MIVKTEPRFLSTPILSMDSRRIMEPEKTAFFAIQGVHHDGHQYLESLYQRGVRTFIVEEKAWNPVLEEQCATWPGVDIYVVPSSIQTLQHLAKQHRAQFKYPLIAVTGSNGKTMVKEWLHQVLSARWSTVKNPKSFNSQIGVPLSVWAMRPEHEMAVFEAGISQPGEMARLEEILRPNMGILTNIGEAHGRNFETEDQKLKEKLGLFKHSQRLLFPDKQGLAQRVALAMKDINPSCELIPWSFEDAPKYHNAFVQFQSGQSTIRLRKPAQSECFMQLELPFQDAASLENAINVAMAAYLLGMDPSLIQQKIRQLKPISMRLEIKEGHRNNQLIDDTYNNDLDGLRQALPILNQSNKSNKILILSDLLESGMEEKALYSAVANSIAQYPIDQLYGVGEALSRQKALFPRMQIFRYTEDLKNSGILEGFQEASILFKGARRYHFEQLVQAIENKSHTTQLEINLNAIEHNLRYFKAQIGPETKLMGMVKAFAYGAGAGEIANVLQHQGIDYLTVAYTDEGVQLRKNGIYLPIMVMNPSVHELDTISAYALEPEIYHFGLLKAVDEYCHSAQKNLKIHIKLDTGMKRLGFEPEEVDALCKELQQMPSLWVASIMSHLAASESEKHYKFTEKQIKTFQQGAKKISQALGYQPLLHLANSAAINHHPKSRFDMVRLGIGLYGIPYTKEDAKQLDQVLSLKTYVSQVKSVKKGESIGYGRKGKLNSDGKIATIAIGYADGFPRALGLGKFQVEIKGSLCPTVGTICMDMCMVDVSHIPNINAGDEVKIFGGKVQIQQLAKSAETIPYEIMTGISDRVRRVYVRS